jgi:hypothetical protein
MKPSSASAIPETGIAMATTITGKWSRFFCHRSFQDQAGVIFAKSGDIDAGCPILDLKGIHSFFILMKLEWFLVGLHAWLVFHGILPS